MSKLKHAIQKGRVTCVGRQLAMASKAENAPSLTLFKDRINSSSNRSD